VAVHEKSIMDFIVHKGTLMRGSHLVDRLPGVDALHVSSRLDVEPLDIAPGWWLGRLAPQLSLWSSPIGLLCPLWRSVSQFPLVSFPDGWFRVEGVRAILADYFAFHLPVP
jgi:hypothetical protein